MPTSRQYGRSERQQAYAAARAVQSMARKLRGRKLSTKEARALTELAATAAGGSARSARSITGSGKYKSRKKRRSAIRRETRGYVRKVTGGKKRSAGASRRSSASRSGTARRSRKSRSLRGWTPSRRQDRKFKATWKQASYGPVPFAQQGKKTRKKYLKEWKRKGYRRVRRYA